MVNIMICGVGGQGLVMTSGIIADVALNSGFDVKTNDVIGLSQRGGRVWASIRFGEKVYSPNIQSGSLDYLLALEPLEGYRYSHMLKDDGVILMNEKVIYPSDVVFDKAEYPVKEIHDLLDKFESYALNASEIGQELGNKMVANTIILGMLASQLTFESQAWLEIIKERVPKKAVEINEKAFMYGYDYVTQKSKETL